MTAAGTVSQTSPALGTYVVDSTCSMDGRYRPAGWESAVDLGRGRVLVAGGAPTVTGTCNDCDDGGSDFRCATAQASLFTAPSTLAPALEKMQIARYGHTATLMRDGNVLIVGGVTSAAGAPRMLARRRGLQPAADRPAVRRHRAAIPTIRSAGDCARCASRAPSSAPPPSAASCSSDAVARALFAH